MVGKIDKLTKNAGSHVHDDDETTTQACDKALIPLMMLTMRILLLKSGITSMVRMDDDDTTTQVLDQRLIPFTVTTKMDDTTTQVWNKDKSLIIYVDDDDDSHVQDDYDTTTHIWATIIIPSRMLMRLQSGALASAAFAILGHHILDHTYTFTSSF